MTNNSKLPQVDASLLDLHGYSSVTELMRAIILRTIDDYHTKPNFKDEALEYLYDDEDEYIFSFRNICSYIGFDYKKTRDKILCTDKKISTRRRAA